MQDDQEDENDKNRGQIVSFPDADKRKKIRKEREEIEKAKKANQSKWRQAYKSQEKSEKVPFFSDRVRNIPPFTKFTALGFIIIHLLTVLLPAEQYEWLILNLAFIPARFTGTLEWNALAVLTPVTSLYLHLDFMHLAMNSFMMLIMGMFFETSFGARRSLLFFMICGLSGNLAFFLLNPGLIAPVMGASGAIDGFFAVFLIINWTRLPLPPHIRKRGYAPVMLFWIGLTLLSGFLFPGTAWEAHLGGLLTGWGILELWKRGKIHI